jgi:hypothetical protein
LKSERLASWLTVVANLGVLGGLFLLAYELNQNTQLLRAQAISTQLSGQIAAETAFMGDDAAEAFAAAMTSPADLEDEEIATVWAYLNISTIAAQDAYLRYSLGLATEEDKFAAARSAASWVSFPFGLAWWEMMKPNFPAEMVRDLDAALAEIGENALRDQFMALRRSLEGMPGLEEAERRAP